MKKLLQVSLFAKSLNYFLPHVSLTSSYHSATNRIENVRQSGFVGKLQSQLSSGMTLKKMLTSSFLCFTIFLIQSFTFNSGSELSNQSMMPLSDTPDWVVNFGYSFGSASGTAGDVNGDGYSDVIVGKKENTTNFTNDGKVFVFLGSATGLFTTEVWSDIGANEGSAYGHSLATAGDVNGDGYDDIIIGEPGFKVAGISRGRALVYYGSSLGPSVTPSWTYVGLTTDIGRSVYSAGDVNNDGYDDVIIGAAYGGLDSTTVNRGAAYVFHGSASGLSSTPDWQLNGPQSFGQFGHSVCTAGDINNDGYSDVIVGAPVNSGANGQAFVYPGSSTGLSTTSSWTGTGEAANHHYGYVVCRAGDVNGDGYDDVVVGTPDAFGTGKVYVYHGSVSGLSASANWTATGAAASEFGFRAGTAGDYNGDGYSDMMVGAPEDSTNGKAFLYEGTSTGLTLNSVWSAAGDGSVAAFGFYAGTAGDVNNDGYDDILITPYSPKAFVYHGEQEAGRVVVTGAVAGNGAYPTLAAAFTEINALPQTNAVIEIRIDSNITEPVTGASLNANSWTSLTIIPNGNIFVNGPTNLGIALITITGADNVVIDGLNSGGSSLTITNSTTSFNTPAIKFMNDASSNRIRNCTILAGTTSTSTSTVIEFGNTNQANGNDNNSISYCNLGKSGPNLTFVISGTGSTGTTAQNNSNDSIINCNIYDYFTNSGATGISLGSGNNSFVIMENKIYQTVPRNSTSTFSNSGIVISGDGHQVTGNIIGYSSPNGTGTYAISSSSSVYFRGIYLAGGTGTPNSVQGNIIKAISMTGNINSIGFAGIYINSGSANIGNINGNYIGDSTGTGINIAGTSGILQVNGIHIRGSGTSLVNSNYIAGMEINSTNNGEIRFKAIENLSSGNFNCSNNRIGSTLTNSIRTISTNQFADTKGIASSGGNSTITGNVIRNINANGGFDVSERLNGIYIWTGGTHVISKNIIHSISNTNPDTTTFSTASDVTGIFAGQSSGTATITIEKNFIHSLKTNSAHGSITGINADDAAFIISNNMIRLGINESGSSINYDARIYGILESYIASGSNYHNSVYIGGNALGNQFNRTYCMLSPSITNPVRTYRNNIFYNARSSPGSTNIHFCLSFANMTNITSNNNILFANGTAGAIGIISSTPYTTFQDWKNGSGQDANSKNLNPQFANPTGSAASADMHLSLTTPTPAERNGVSEPSVTTDFDDQTRSSVTPHDIGADAGNFAQTDTAALSISYTPITTVAGTTSYTFSGVSITDLNGVNGNPGSRPRVYYKKKNDVNSFNTNNNASPGWKYSESTGSSSPFTFSIDFSRLPSGVTTNDTIQYFVVAQDNASVPHVGMNSGTFNQLPTSVNLLASAFPVTGAVNSFRIFYSVIVSGAVFGNGNYAALADAFGAINSSNQFGSNILIRIIDNTTEPAAGAQLNNNNWTSLTIIPEGGQRTISGPGTNGLVYLNGADKVTINGADSTGAKNLIIAGTSTTQPAITFRNDARFNIVKNCIIKGNTASFTSGVLHFSTAATLGNDSNLIMNNDITRNTNNTHHCIYNSGTGTTSNHKNSGNVISGNRIFDFTSRGIVDEGNSAGTIYEGNEIFSTFAQSNFQVGCRIFGNNIEGFTFRNNNTHDLRIIGLTLVYGLEVNSIQNSSTGEIYNNIITLSEQNSNDIRGITENCPGTVTLNIYHNSINLHGPVTGTKNSQCYYRSGGSNSNFKNNILVNSKTGGTGKHYAIRTTSPLNNLLSDYNDIHSTGGTANVFGITDAVERVNLTEWQSATLSDSNSISADPMYISKSNLHIDSTVISPVNNAGTPVAGITNDFDGNTRSLTAPDIGADEFNGVVPQEINLEISMLIEGFYNSSSNLQISDTIKVYLRNSSSPYDAVDSATAVLNDSGKANLIFSNAASGNYYIQLKHRNAIETWSANTVSVTQGGANQYDFTTSASQAFGDNLKQVDSSPNEYAVFSGDVNHDETIDLTDIINIFNDANAFTSGYVVTDLTGDDFVDLSDLTIAFNNSNAFVSVIRP